MRLRRLAAVGLLVVAGRAGGQPPRAELPPLLTPPAAPVSRPVAPPVRGPAGEYDHAHLYLPDYRPAAPAEPRGLLARWRARRGEPNPPGTGATRWPAAITRPRD